MKMSTDTFLRIAKELYSNEEYNKTLSELSYTRDTKKYTMLLLNAFKIQDKVIKSYDLSKEAESNDK